MAMIKKRAQKNLDIAVRRLMEEYSIENYAQAFITLKRTRPGLIAGYDFICRREGRRGRGLAVTKMNEELHQQILACAKRDTLTYLEAYEAVVHSQ
jgi:hypothetical protein